MINLNTVKAMLKDEAMASREYLEIAKKEKDPAVKRQLLEIAAQEQSHFRFWKQYFIDVSSAKHIYRGR